MISFLLSATRGYRLQPWRSPYLLWRMETYWGMSAESITAGAFWKFSWDHRGELWRFLRWASRLAGERV